jgi:tight adherence protein C
MSLDVVTLFIILGASLVLGGFIYISFSIRAFRGNRMAQRLLDFVIEQPIKRAEEEIEIKAEEFTESLFRRTVVPILKSISSFFGRLAPENTTQELNRQLAVIHMSRIKAREFNGIRVIFILLGLVLGSLMLVARGLETKSLVLSGAIVVLFALLPTMWLRVRHRNAQAKIARALPDALDMFSVCASAGLAFDQSLQKVSDYWANELGTEFTRVVGEMEVGISRADALRNMSARLQVNELSSFVAVITNAEITGMSIADVLHSQADQMRLLRQFRAKEIANQLPAKMIIPLALFILPALMAVIIGPMVPTFMNNFF